MLHGMSCTQTHAMKHADVCARGGLELHSSRVNKVFYVVYTSAHVDPAL